MTGYLLDSNAYDAILRHGDAARLAAAGLTLRPSGHVLAELRQVPEAARRRALLDLFQMLHGAAPPAPPSMASRDALLRAEARAAGAVLVSDDKALGALPYAAFRQLFQPGDDLAE